MSITIQDLRTADLSTWGVGEWGHSIETGERLREDGRLSMWCALLPKILLSAIGRDSIRTWRIERHRHRDWVFYELVQYEQDALDEVAHMTVTAQAGNPVAWAHLAIWGWRVLYPAYEDLTGSQHACADRVDALYLDVVMSENTAESAA